MVYRLSSMVLAVAMVFAAEQAQAVTDTITHSTTTINMDFVTVGNPGNGGDTAGSPYLG